MPPGAEDFAAFARLPVGARLEETNMHERRRADDERRNADQPAFALAAAVLWTLIFGLVVTLMI